MKSAIVLVMHGAPPNDFPRDETTEFFGLASRIKRANGPEREELERRHAALEAKMRAWPRTPNNDPFHEAANEMGEQLALATGHETIVGFNEFCSPTLDDALDSAAALPVERVIVITPMVTRGGGHSEREIPAAVDAARRRHTDTNFVYVWPFKASDVAAFLASQIEAFVE